MALQLGNSSRGRCSGAAAWEQQQGKMQRCCSWGAAAEIDTVALRLGKDSEELRAGGSSKHSELQVELEVKQR
jgi:hypothetical protein